MERLLKRRLSLGLAFTGIWVVWGLLAVWVGGNAVVIPASVVNQAAENQTSPTLTNLIMCPAQQEYGLFEVANDYVLVDCGVIDLSSNLEACRLAVANVNRVQTSGPDSGTVVPVLPPVPMPYIDFASANYSPGTSASSLAQLNLNETSGIALRVMLTRDSGANASTMAMENLGAIGVVVAGMQGLVATVAGFPLPVLVYPIDSQSEVKNPCGLIGTLYTGATTANVAGVFSATPGLQPTLLLGARHPAPGPGATCGFWADQLYVTGETIPEAFPASTVNTACSASNFSSSDPRTYYTRVFTPVGGNLVEPTTLASPVQAHSNLLFYPVLNGTAVNAAVTAGSSPAVGQAAVSAAVACASDSSSSPPVAPFGSAATIGVYCGALFLDDALNRVRVCVVALDALRLVVGAGPLLIIHAQVGVLTGDAPAYTPAQQAFLLVTTLRYAAVNGLVLHITPEVLQTATDAERATNLGHVQVLTYTLAVYYQQTAPSAPFIISYVVSPTLCGGFGPVGPTVTDPTGPLTLASACGSES